MTIIASWPVVVVISIALSWSLGLAYHCLFNQPKILGRWERRSYDTKIEDITVLILGCAIVLVAMASPLYYEFPHPEDEHALYEIKDDTLIERPWGAFQLGGRTLAVVPTSDQMFEVAGVVKPITENPKVRTISYSVISSVVDAKLYLADPKRHRLTSKAGSPFSPSVQRDVEDLVKYCQYELHEAHSSDLADFYNPLDEEQVAYYGNLISGYLNDCLAPTGVEIVKIIKLDVS